MYTCTKLRVSLHEYGDKAKFGAKMKKRQQQPIAQGDIFLTYN